MRLFLKIALPIFALYLILSLSYLSSDELDCDAYACWDGIVLGKTTLKEAHFMLERLYGRENVDLYETRLLWNKLDTPTLAGLFIAQRNTIVDYVSIFFLESPPTIESMIADYGKPSRVSVFSAFNTPCGAVYLLFEDRYAVAMIDDREFSGKIEPDRIFWELSLFSPLEFSADSYEDQDFTLLDWQGYGDYCELLEEK